MKGDAGKIVPKGSLRTQTYAPNVPLTVTTVSTQLTANPVSMLKNLTMAHAMTHVQTAPMNKDSTVWTA